MKGEVASLLVVTCDVTDQHLALARSYSEFAQHFLASVESCAVRNVTWGGDATGLQQGADVIVFFSHGCIFEGRSIDCTRNCDSFVKDDRACFAASTGIAACSVRHATTCTTLGIYGATVCNVGRIMTKYASSLSTSYLGYAADFRHVFIAEGQANPFEDIVNAPFKLPNQLPAFENWQRIIVGAYDRWLQAKPEAIANYENWWLVRACLRHNRCNLVYCEGNSDA